MADIKSLTELMKELDAHLSVCNRCGTCQVVCPVFSETRLEADVARGKLALLDGLVQEMFKDPRGVSERLNRCLLCGSCEKDCPSSVNILEIFIKARAILTGYMGLSSVKKAIFRQVLAKPALFDSLMESISKYQKLFIRQTNESLGTSCARVVSPVLANRHFKHLAPVPFHRMVSSQSIPPRLSEIKTAFFTGCLIDKIFPNVAQASLEVLKHYGVGVFIPEGQGCCGIPVITAGDTETYNKLVRYNLELFEAEHFDFLITACATCTFTIKKIWPLMFRTESADLKARIKKLSDKTLDISRFLVTRIGLKKKNHENSAGDIVTTYHDPCHLKKSLDISNEPRELIKASPRFSLKEMAEADRCCGLGGSFNLKHYEISTAIGKRKRDNIKSTGCSVVATSCPACMMQLSDILSKHKDTVSVKHPIEIYAESL